MEIKREFQNILNLDFKKNELEAKVMAKILVSIPDNILTKIDEYKNRKKIKRNQFLINALENYFQSLWEEDYVEKKKKAVESVKKTSEEIMSLGIKDWDPVAEIRKFRDTHADELLKRWKA